MVKKMTDIKIKEKLYNILVEENLDNFLEILKNIPELECVHYYKNDEEFFIDNFYKEPYKLLCCAERGCYSIDDEYVQYIGDNLVSYDTSEVKDDIESNFDNILYIMIDEINVYDTFDSDTVELLVNIKDFM